MLVKFVYRRWTCRDSHPIESCISESSAQRECRQQLIPSPNSPRLAYRYVRRPVSLPPRLGQQQCGAIMLTARPMCC